MTCARRAGADVVTVRGDLDARSHDRLRTLPRAADFTQPLLVVDLLAIGHVDALGLGALSVLHRSAEQRGARLVVLAGSRTTRLLGLAGLAGRLSVVSSWEDVSLPAAPAAPRRPVVAATPAPADTSAPGGGPPARGQRDEGRLAMLLAQVRQARAAFESGRGEQGGPGTHQRHTGELAGRLARTMQAYADTAAGCGIPLPYRYRDEMRLYLSLAAHAERDGSPGPASTPGTPGTPGAQRLPGTRTGTPDH